MYVWERFTAHSDPQIHLLWPKLVLCRNEVRILIFDDPAELEKRQRPVMFRSGRGPFKPARQRRGRAMHEFFFENLRNPARIRRAGLIRQFCPIQLDSRRVVCLTHESRVYAHSCSTRMLYCHNTASGCWATQAGTYS
jgi:hypothetical protein